MTCQNSARERFRQVAFRVTQEQADAIDRMVALSGMTKQDYIAARLLDEEVTVVPSTRVIKALKDHCLLIARELQALETSRDKIPVPSALEDDLDRLLRVLEGFQGASAADIDPIRALNRYR